MEPFERVEDYEIIDFHTHPFFSYDSNICFYKDTVKMSVGQITDDLAKAGISRFCGAVVQFPDKFDPDMSLWDMVHFCNTKAIELSEAWGNVYIPGFNIHPEFPRQSCDEIESMAQKGIKLMGELVPYFFKWKNEYGPGALDDILECAAANGMIVNFHTTESHDEMNAMVKRHPNVIFVAAHPGEPWEFEHQLERMEMSENYYVDLSGYGLFRHGMLAAGIKRFGAERFIFGSDYPTCNPYMYVGGVLLDPMLSRSDKELIFSGNAKRLLGLV